MCGRFVSRIDRAMEQYFATRPADFHYQSYNVAPGTLIPAVRAADGERALALLHWGLIPAWAKDRTLAHKMINARAETLTQKPAFRAAFRTRRCLIPANGFYEWDRCVSPRQPYYIYRADGAPLGLAGLWETWTDRETGEAVDSCTIVTTEANQLMAPIHHRMPVVLEPDGFDVWLTGTAGEAAERMGPYAGGDLKADAVGRRVNSPQHNDPELIEPVNSGQR